MLHETAQPGRRRRVILMACLGCVVLFGATVLVVHTAPFRAFALRYAVRAALGVGVRLEATRLDYNLATLRVGLVGVRASAVGEEQPFFEAEEVEASVSTRIFAGDVSFDEVVIRKGSVHIVRRTDGATNLPRTTGGSQAEPASLPIVRLLASGLGVDYRDEGNDLALRIPSLTLDLSPRGRLALDAPAEVALGATSTRIERLEGGVAFDGRDLQLSDVRLEATEVRARVDGRLAIFRREPGVDLQLSGDSDLSRAAMWWGQSVTEAPQGVMHFEGAVRGPFGDPSADLMFGSDRVMWTKLDIGGLSGQVHLDADGLEVVESRLEVAGGSARVAGGVTWETGMARVNVSWRDVEAARFVGALIVSDVVPAGPTSGTIVARGPIDAIERWDIDGRLDVGQGITGRGRVSVPGQARIRLTDGQWRLEAEHIVGGSAPVSMALQGQLADDIATSSIGGVIQLAPTEMAALSRTLEAMGLGSVSADLLRGSLTAQADVRGTLTAPTLGLELASDSASIARQPVVNVRARGRLTASEVAFESLTAEQPPPDGPSGAAGRLQASGRFDFDRGIYEVVAALEKWRLVPSPDVPLGGVLDATYSGEGRAQAPTGRGRLTVSDLAWQDVGVGNVQAEVELDGEVARIEATVPDFGAAVNARVQLDAPYATTAQANAGAVDLARVFRDAGLTTLVRGTASVQVSAEGPLEHWRDGQASLQIASLDALVDDLSIRLREPARARYEAGRLVVDRLEASAGETHLSASGALPVWAGGPASPDSLLVTLTGDLGEVVRSVNLAAGKRGPFVSGGSGPVAGLARITGSAMEPVLAADLEVGPSTLLVRSDLPLVTDLRVHAHLQDGVLELRDLTGSYQDAHLTARGQAPLALLTGSSPEPAAGTAVLQARATGITPAVLLPFVDRDTVEQITGSLDATVDLTAPALDLDLVRGEVVLERLDLALANVPVRQRRPTLVTVRDGFARVEEWNWEGEGASLEVRGTVHLSDLESAILVSGGLDARLLTPFLRDAGVTTAGRVEPRLSITGPLAEPTINGDLRLLDGELRIREPRIVVSELDARAILARGQAYLTSLSGMVNGGTLTGSGRLDYAPDVQGRFTVEVSGMALDFPEGLRSEVDSSLELTATAAAGQAVPDSRLSGTVTVKRSAYREPVALVAGLLANLRRATTTATGTTRNPLLDRLALDVRVITDEDLVIQNNVARAGLGADLRVIGVASAPSLSGRAELREGGQLFLGRNTYTVESGTIDFVNPVAIVPILAVVATTRAGGEDIEVEISGTPDALVTGLSSPSNPDLGQGDLSSLLLTGRRLDELNTQEAAVVSAQVLGNLSGDVLGIAGRAVGLDTLRVGGIDASTSIRDPADLASEVDPTSRLTFGKSLGSKLDITMSQSLLEGDALTWIIDYLPVRRIALRLVSNDEDLRSYEFRHDLTFGTGPQAIRSGDVSRDLEPPRVSAVRILGEPGFPEERLRQQLRHREGSRFDFIAWQEDRDRLERFYRGERRLEARIVTSRRETPDGTELTYELTAGPETVVRASGVQLPRAALEEIETAWAQAVFDGFLVEEVEGIVRRELARDGVYQASVKVNLVDGEATRALEIAVEQEARAERIEVRLEGVDDPLRSDLLGVWGDRARAQIAVTSPEEYERMLAGDLQARGYLQASVTVGTPSFEGAVVAVPVVVDAGPRFRVGRLTFDGAKGIDLDALRSEAALDEGVDYHPEAVEEARGRLQSRYRREGYATAVVELRPQIRSADEAVDLAFIVQEGPQQVVSDVTISGLRSVGEDVVTRALRLKVGDGLRAADWLEARRRLFETGLFRRVDISIEPAGEPGPTAPVRLRVLVEEWPALRVRYGFQVSEERPEEEVNGRDLVPGVSADATRRTLFGRAITVGGAVQYERRQRLGRLFMSTPMLAGWPVQSGLVLERAREESTAATLVTDRTTASWEQRVRHGPLSLSYALRFERNHTFDTAPLEPDFAFDLTLHSARLNGSVAWDTRDDPADTTTGTFVASTVDHASARLGSDLLYVRSLSQAYHFRSWRGVVLASAGRYGVVRALGGQELLGSLHFFAGGARTLRGVPEDGLGARDFLGNPVGGEGLLVFNQEVRFPLYRWVRGVAFVDAGNVFARPRDVGLGALIGSGGVGLRIGTPFALLRVDYGRTIWNAPAVDSGRWAFGIGQTF